METSVEMVDIEARKITYSFLSSMFLKEVTEDMLHQWAQNPPFVEGELGSFCASLSSSDIAQVRVNCAAQFASLLLNMCADPVYPYESTYTSNERLLMQNAQTKVVAAYRSAGFKSSDSVTIPEDHIGIEFEFMARLCQKELDALQAEDSQTVAEIREAQKQFLQDHLMNWVPQMCDDLNKRAKSSLYKGLAETTKQFLEFEAEELA